MSRLVWTESRNGWQSGRYRIELAAPQLWVLSRRPRRDDGGLLSKSQVVRTAGSLRHLKRAAAELERRRERHRRLLTHLAMAIALIGVAVTSDLLGWGLVIPAVVGVFAISLRILVIWVEGATGSAWAVLSDHYQ